MTTCTAVRRCLLRGSALDEIAKFSLLNKPDSWSASGPMRALHLLNHVRVPYLVEMVHRYAKTPYSTSHRPAAVGVTSACTTESTSNGGSTHPMAGRTPSLANSPLHILDVGCGGGVLSECLVRLGARVTGVDACAESVAAARQRQRDLIANDAPSCQSAFMSDVRQACSEGAGPAVDSGAVCNASAETTSSMCAETTVWGDSRLQFRHASIIDMAESTLDRAQYDVVVASEVIEHVSDARSFLTALCDLVRPGGLLFLTTMDKSILAALKYVFVAEYLTGIVPRHTHDWTKFVPPRDLSRFARRCGVHEVDLSYITARPNIASSIASCQLQLSFGRSVSRNTGHYMWTGVKCGE